MAQRPKLAERAQQRIRNARFYLRKLIKQGRYEDARKYAEAQGLAMEGPGAAPSVDSDITPSNPEPVSTPSPTMAFGPGGHPVAVLHRTKEITELGRRWKAFATRLRQQRASSVIGWEEFQALEERLGFKQEEERVIEAVRKQVEERKLNTDPHGTVRATIVKIPPNRMMRVIELPDGTEGVAWVKGTLHVLPGDHLWVVPNEDERGGWLQVGEYGKKGGRLR